MRPYYGISNRMFWVSKIKEDHVKLMASVSAWRRFALCLYNLQYKMEENQTGSFMRKDLLEQYEIDLIYEISSLAGGVGGKKAGAIAEYFGTTQAFLVASKSDFQGIKNALGKSVLSDEIIDSLMRVKGDIVQGQTITRTWIYFLAKIFIRGQVQAIKDIRFEDIDINPLLAKALDLKTPDEVIRFNIYQSITRSVVTSWGSMVEKMLKYSGCELDGFKVGIKGREPDLTKKIGKKMFCFQIKSGPNTMNVDMIESLNKVIDEVEKRGHVGLLGMTYGRKERISQQILGNLKDAGKRTKIGRELWDFIAESSNYHREVIAILDMATSNELKVSYIEMIEAKVQDFCKEWDKKYKGLSMNKVLENYI